MITIILSTIIGIVIALIIEYKSDSYYKMYFPSIILGAMFGIMFGMLLAICVPSETEIVQTKFNIEALQDNSSISGRFYVGSGRIEQEMKYMMYLKLSEGLFLEEISAKNTIIQYTTSNTATLIVYSTVLTKNLKNHFSIRYLPHKNYLILVPKGTIKANYTLDAQ